MKNETLKELEGIVKKNLPSLDAVTREIALALKEMAERRGFDDGVRVEFSGSIARNVFEYAALASPVDGITLKFWELNRRGARIYRGLKAEGYYSRKKK